MRMICRIRSSASSTGEGQYPFIRAVDLFCGAGGLTRGLAEAGIDVTLGIDINPACEYSYTANNTAAFRLKAVENVSAAEVSASLNGGTLKLLAGCAPCQPFSTYNQGRKQSPDVRWNLLQHFSRLATGTCPDLITMENVLCLRKEAVFREFVLALQREGFHVSYSIINCADYGVPQQRKRLVLFASRMGLVAIIPPTTPGARRVSVKDAIGHLPPLEAGGSCNSDALNTACRLSPLNLRRIRASKQWGTWRDWDSNLRAACYKKASGLTFASVYGRMAWDRPAQTLTTQYYGYGHGHFGHPEQDRAISLREGAILQSFPDDYRFVPPGEVICRNLIGRLVGNAVPIRLGQITGLSIIRHIQGWSKS